MTAEEIETRIAEMAADIDRDYAGKTPLCISILNGSFMFAAGLFKHISVPAEISFVKLVSYKGTRSTGNVITSIGLEENIADRHIIIIEDIIDTGKTMHEFLPELQKMSPASIKLCVLLQKPTALQHPVTIDYLGFSIPDKFVLGYGLDYDGLGRNINGIYRLAE